MGSIAKVFSADKFIIDEKPLDLSRLDSQISVSTNGGKTNALAEGAGSEVDVFSILSALMVERVGLQEEIEKLKAAKPQEDEFGAFAKQTVHFIDAMERILQLGKAQPPSDEIKVWIQGIESAYRRILKLFERHQLKVMSYIGQEVDLGIHEVIEYRETKDYPHNTIIEEPLKSITFRGRTLREAKVVVACNQ